MCGSARGAHMHDTDVQGMILAAASRVNRRPGLVERPKSHAVEASPESHAARRHRSPKSHGPAGARCRPPPCDFGHARDGAWNAFALADANRNGPGVARAVRGEDEEPQLGVGPSAWWVCS